MESKRLFLALNLPDDLKSAIGEVVLALRKQNPGIKWVDPQGAHITLQFLGDIDHALEEAIRFELKELSGKYGNIIFKTADFGAFPNLKFPRVLFLDCAQQNGDTAPRLQTNLKNICQNLGILTDHKFWTPHITLGRIKEEISLNLAVSFPNLPQEFSVDSFELMESELTPRGSIYRIVESYKL